MFAQRGSGEAICTFYDNKEGRRDRAERLRRVAVFNPNSREFR